MPPEIVWEMYEREFHAAIDGFSEKSSLCSRTVARRMKKLVTSGLPLREWNVQHVLDWLEYAGLQQHRELFRRAEVDGSILLKLSSETLRTKVDIRSYGHRQNIMEEVDRLRDRLKSFVPASASGNPPSIPVSPRSAGSTDAAQSPSSVVPADVPSEELLAQLRSQRGQWVRDRKHLMAMLGTRVDFLGVPPAKWTIQQVCDWMDHIGLSPYRKLFAHGSINGRFLMEMTLETLQSEVGIRSLEHRSMILAKLRSLVQGNTSSDANLEVHHCHLTAERLGQVQGHMRECDFNIMRLDQRIAKVKQRLGIDEPKTQTYRECQRKVEDFREELEHANTRKQGSGEKWWNKHYAEYNEKMERMEKLRVKIRKEEEIQEKNEKNNFTSRANSNPHGHFMIRHL
jgi:hypothetical protein